MSCVPSVCERMCAVFYSKLFYKSNAERTWVLQRIPFQIQKKKISKLRMWSWSPVFQAFNFRLSKFCGYQSEVWHRKGHERFQRRISRGCRGDHQNTDI